MSELLMSLLPSRLGKNAQFSSGKLVTGSKLQSPPLVISLKKLKYLEIESRITNLNLNGAGCSAGAALARLRPNQNKKDRKWVMLSTLSTNQIAIRQYASQQKLGLISSLIT